VKLVTIAAMAFLGLSGCAADEQLGQSANRIPEPGQEVGATQSAATASIPVTVVNGASDPVPTTIRGTAQVAGTVALAAGTAVGIAGTPSVNVANAVTLGGQSTVGIDPTRNAVQVVSMPSIIGTVTCEQSAPFATNVIGTPNVNVVSMPQVQLAGTPPVNVVSMPQVQLAGTPNVNVVSIPSVQLAGTPTVNVANFPAGQGGVTTLASHQVVTVTNGALLPVDAVDVSAFRDVRVMVTATGVADFQFYTFIVDDTGQGRNLLLENDIIQGSGEGTRLYTMPGRKISFLILGPSFGQSEVTISVFGRGT
jgi:hypothetical protein